MFGILRYVLAMLVVFGHLWPWHQDTMNWSGHYSVFTFYLLSGYLMTLVLNERYGFSRHGLLRFVANRALRIYPPYLVVLLISGIALALMPEICRQMGPRFRLPVHAAGWVQHFAIFGLHNLQPRMVPVSWSLSVELIFYLAMAFGLSRSRRNVLVWVAASLLYTAWGVAADWRFSDRFSPPTAASIAFALGASVYYLRRLGSARWLLAPSAVVFLVNVLAARFLWANVQMEGFYVSLAASFGVVWGASLIPVERVPGWLLRVDRQLGDLAYAIFLCHFLVGALMLRFVFGGTRPPSQALMFVASLPLLHALSWAIQRGVEHPVAALRARLRPASPAVNAS